MMMLKFLLLERISKSNNPSLLVELGYNYQLKGNIEISETYYTDAIISINENPAFTYSVAKKLQDHSLLRKSDYRL